MHNRNPEITAPPKGTIAGTIWGSKNERKKVDMDRSHKKIRSDYNGTMSGKPGTDDSASEAEKQSRDH
jgi:hypothetical protein